MGQNLQQTVSQNIGKITTISGVGKKKQLHNNTWRCQNAVLLHPAAPMVLFFFQNPVFVSPPAKLSGLKMVPFMI